MPALTTVSTRGSSYSHSDKKPKASFFGAIKGIFSNSSKPKQSKQRRLSILSVGSNEHRLSKEEELEQRRHNCLAIKTAKNEPVEVQRLLVDCEFCNPPPKYGRTIEIVTPQFPAASVQPLDLDAIKDIGDESSWNVGLNEWEKTRDWWTKKTAGAVPPHYGLTDVSPEKYFVIYDKFARHTRPLKEPLNLDDTIKLLKAGWVGEGTWPDKIDPEDRWTDDVSEEETAVSLSLDGSNDTQSQTANGKPNVNRMYNISDSSGGSESHVQFKEAPHPRSQLSGLKRIERTQSATSHNNLTLMPTRSNTSSLVSMTSDEEADPDSSYHNA